MCLLPNGFWMVCDHMSNHSILIDISFATNLTSKVLDISVFAQVTFVVGARQEAATAVFTPVRILSHVPVRMTSDSCLTGENPVTNVAGKFSASTMAY